MSDDKDQPKPIDNNEYDIEKDESKNKKNDNKSDLDQELKNIENDLNKIDKDKIEKEKINEEYQKKEEDIKQKKLEIEKNKKEDEEKKLNQYNEKRIDIKDIFIPKVKYDKENFYDVIIKINLINELMIDGWEIIYSKEKYEQNINKKLIPISVIGESNKGKSYLLGRICNIDLPIGFNEKTEGISVKYLSIGQSYCALIDSAGGQTPIIKDNKNNEYFIKFIKDILIEEEKLKDEGKNQEEIEKIIEEIKKAEIDIEEIKNKKENLFNKCLKQIISDKTITEQFIKDFAINKSKIILIIVGQLTISEQLMINNIKNFDINKDKEIIIIHNLLNFVKKKQVEDYINDVLKKSIYFNLEERQMTEMDNVNENIKKDANDKYFIEKYYDEVNKKSRIIRHLIIANDSKESEAGNYYNYSSIDFIKKIIVSISNQINFDIIKELKEFLIQESIKYLDTNDEQKKKDEIIPINEDNIIIEEKNNENNQKKSYLMKIKNISKIKLKKLQADESGNFKYIGNAFTPPFSYYTEFVKKDFFKKKDDKKENKKEDKKENDDLIEVKENKKEKNDLIEVFVISIELAGKIKDIHSKIITRNGKYYVNIRGIRELPKVREMQYYYSEIDENDFRIEFELNIDELELKSNKLKKSIINDGIIKLYYEIKPKEEENSEINVINKTSENKEPKKKKKDKNKEDKTKENKDPEKKKDKNKEDKTKENKDTEKIKKDKKNEEENKETVKKKKDKKKEDKKKDENKKENNNNESEIKIDNENEDI
jgi:hypothetical protein